MEDEGRMLTRLYIKIKCFLFQHRLDDDKKRKVNMIGQIICGGLFIILGVVSIGKWVYDIGKYPSDLTDGYASYWYESESDSMLSVDAAMFTFISNNNNVYIEGEVTDKTFVSDIGSITYSISDGKCYFEYQQIKYELTYCASNSDNDIVKDFESRLIEKSE